MFDFDFLMHTLLRIWLVLFGYMVFSKIGLAIIQGVKRGVMISKIKTNVNKRLAEIDDDMQKYYNYEVENNDISDMHEQSKRE